MSTALRAPFSAAQRPSQPHPLDCPSQPAPLSLPTTTVPAVLGARPDLSCHSSHLQCPALPLCLTVPYLSFGIQLTHVTTTVTSSHPIQHHPPWHIRFLPVLCLLPWHPAQCTTGEKRHLQPLHQTVNPKCPPQLWTPSISTYWKLSQCRVNEYIHRNSSKPECMPLLECHHYLL